MNHVCINHAFEHEIIGIFQMPATRTPNCHMTWTCNLQDLIRAWASALQTNLITAPSIGWPWSQGKSYWLIRITWGHVTSGDWLVMQDVTNYINYLQLLGVECLLYSLWVHIELTSCNSGVHLSWQQPLHRCPSVERAYLLQHCLKAAQPLVVLECPKAYILILCSHICDLINFWTNYHS